MASGDTSQVMLQDLFESVAFLLAMPDADRALLSAVTAMGNRLSEQVEAVLESTDGGSMEEVRRAVFRALPTTLFLMLVLQNLFDGEGQYKQPKDVLLGMMKDLVEARGTLHSPNDCH